MDSIIFKFKENGILLFKDIIKLELCKFCYLYKSDCIPHVLKVLIPGNENVHGYETYKNKLQNISKHTNAQNNCSFLMKSTMSHIQIKNIIKRNKNVHLFIKSLKKYILDRY